MQFMWRGSLAACGSCILQRRAYVVVIAVVSKKEHRVEIEKIMQEYEIKVTIINEKIFKKKHMDGVEWSLALSNCSITLYATLAFLRK
jgi:hypothetical protein